MRKSLNDKLIDMVQYEFLPLKTDEDVKKVKYLKSKGWKPVLESLGYILMQK